MVSQAVVRTAHKAATLPEPGTSPKETSLFIHRDRKCSVLYRDYLRLVEARAASIATVEMSPKKQYRCTKPLLYSATRMLGTIANHLGTALHPDLGIKLSYREIAEDLLWEYSEDFLAVAGRLLVQTGLLEPPTQDRTTHRALTWKMPREEIQRALYESHPFAADLLSGKQKAPSYISHADRKCAVLHRDILTLVRARAASIPAITMSPKKTYPCTKPLLFCASKMFGVIAYRLGTTANLHLGIKLSYREIAEDLLWEYSEDFLAVAGRLLLTTGLLDRPTQDRTTQRSLIWKMPYEEIQQALEKNFTTSSSIKRSFPATTSESESGQEVSGSQGEENTRTLVASPASDLDGGYSGYPHRSYPLCNESESKKTFGKEKKDESESDSIPSSLFSFFSSTTWSPVVVGEIITALGVMPSKKWERTIVEQQCQIVFEQMKELPPQEACKRLILSLEYMKTTQVFWKGRFEQGRPVVLSLGSNHDGSHHHCLEMYEELTRRKWTSALEEAWLMETMRQEAERGACMRLAVKMLSALGLPSDHLDFDHLVEIGRPHYARQKARWEAESSGIAVPGGPGNTAGSAEAGGDSGAVPMGPEEAQALLAEISRMLPGIQPYLSCESSEQRTGSISLTPPNDQSGGGVRLTSLADWEKLVQTLDETGWDWNAAMLQLFGDQISAPISEQAGEDVEETRNEGPEAAMSADEATDLAEQIAREIPALAPYIFRGPTENAELATLELLPPCHCGTGVCLANPFGWTLLREALQQAQGDWDAAVGLLFGSPAAGAATVEGDSEPGETNTVVATSQEPPPPGRQADTQEPLPPMSEREAQDLATRISREKPGRDVLISSGMEGLIVQVRFGEEWLEVYHPEQWPHVWEERATRASQFFRDRARIARHPQESRENSPRRRTRMGGEVPT